MLLELKKVYKKFKISRKQYFTALNDINLTFEKGEFVSIVGPSGCGKSTLLNIIAGLDESTKGSLIIGGVSSKKFKKKNWDLYRKNNIGFIFQNFNLIEHLTALENVEIVMNLIGLGIRERRERALELLEQVGLSKHINHRPSELSGGEKQRVAIARALANDPDIILADEPTGALDSKTGKQVMDLLTSLAKDKLIIMVTHNNELADEYSSRIIGLKDGVIESDENITEAVTNRTKSTLKKKNKSMSFFEAFKLSLRNMSKKKGRIAITTLAGCIGITGFALIMGLGNGANIYIDKQLNKFANSDVLMVSKNVKESNDMGSYTTISSDEKDYKKIFEMEEVKASRPMINTNNVKINVGNQESEMVAYSLGNETSEFLKENVDGKLPLKNEILVNQAAAREILKLLNIESKDIKDAIGKEVTFLINVTKDNLEKVTVNENFVVSGVVNELDFDISSIYYNYDAFKEILNETFLTTGTLYDYLTNNSGFEIILKDASDNKLVTNEITAEKNGGAGNILSILSGGTQKEGFMAYNIPVIMKLQFEQLIFIAQIVISIFIIVALVVSSIMTSIVLYSSIVERKTEIGIIKAVGGRDKDVLRIFESEAILMGLFSGVLGVIIAFVLKYPIESLIAKLLGFKLPGIVTIPLSQVPFTNVTFPLATIITLILFSAIISAIAGYLPSKKATKMQVIDALREE